MNAEHQNASQHHFAAPAQLQTFEHQGGSLSALRPGERPAAQEAANRLPQVQQFKAIQMAANQGSMPRQFKAVEAGLTASVQMKENRTGLPDQLKSGVENLSGMALDDVNVHYNSDKPAGLQAHAYAQGTDIHVAPGQERHLPHEAWHVVQQKQGRVQPTAQLKGKVAVNDDEGLEREADVMGAKAMQMQAVASKLEAQDVQAPVAQRAVVAEEEAAEMEGPDPEIMELADQLEAEGEAVTVESLQAAMELEAEGVTEGAPVQCNKQKKSGKGKQTKKSKSTKIKKQKSKPKVKPVKAPKPFVMPLKGSRYHGHDSPQNKSAILEVINYRSDNMEVIGISSLSLPEQITSDTQGFGQTNSQGNEKMSKGTAICHKLAESEVFKSINTLISYEIDTEDEDYLEEYLETLMEYVSPHHIGPDGCPEGGDYEKEVKRKFEVAKLALYGVKSYKIGTEERKILAHELACSVVNSPVNLFNGSSRENSSIQQNLDGNKFKAKDGDTPLSPRSDRAKDVQKLHSDLIKGPSLEKKDKKKLGTEKSSSLL